MSLRRLGLAVALLLTCSLVAVAEEGRKASPLDPIKALAGRWEAKGPDGSTMAVEFRVTAAGGSVVETMFPGSPHEMVNVYTVDGKDVIVTHYCAGGNAPRMKLAEHKDGVMRFEFLDGANIDPQGMYMGKLTLTHQGDELTEDWVSLQKGQEAQHVSFKLTRVKG